MSDSEQKTKKSLSRMNTQKNDRRKNFYAMGKGIEMIRIPYWEINNFNKLVTDRITEVLTDKAVFVLVVVKTICTVCTFCAYQTIMNIYYKKVRLKEMAMEMIEQKLFTEARKELSDVFDTVVIKQRPVVINRRKDAVALIEREQLKELLSRYTASAEELPEQDGSMTIAIDELDIAVNGTDKEAAVKELIEELRSYATDYLERLPLFLAAPNRRSHYPYVLRILLASNDDELLKLIRWA